MGKVACFNVAARLCLAVLVCFGAGFVSEPASASGNQTCEEWAAKLEVYKTDTKPESKGIYGVPSENAQEIKAAKPMYDEAKAVYDEFKQTGMDPDECWQLRQSEYDVRVALENYEGSIERVIKYAEDDLDQACDWLKNYPENAWSFDTWRHERIKNRVADAEFISPVDSPRIKALKEKLDEFNKQISAAKDAAAEKMRMKPDVYKGKDANELKQLAKSIVLKEHPKTKLLRACIISKAWERESVVEWTDTTRTAIQHRTTDGIYAQIAAKEGTDVSLYTLFLNKNLIGGKQGGLQGHIMYKDRIVEKNVGK